jgi:hypothetical protein
VVATQAECHVEMPAKSERRVPDRLHYEDRSQRGVCAVDSGEPSRGSAVEREHDYIATRPIEYGRPCSDHAGSPSATVSRQIRGRQLITFRGGVKWTLGLSEKGSSPPFPIGAGSVRALLGCSRGGDRSPVAEPRASVPPRKGRAELAHDDARLVGPPSYGQVFPHSLREIFSAPARETTPRPGRRGKKHRLSMYGIRFAG